MAPSALRQQHDTRINDDQGLPHRRLCPFTDKEEPTQPSNFQVIKHCGGVGAPRKTKFRIMGRDESIKSRSLREPLCGGWKKQKKNASEGRGLSQKERTSGLFNCQHSHAFEAEAVFFYYFFPSFQLSGMLSLLACRCAISGWLVTRAIPDVVMMMAETSGCFFCTRASHLTQPEA